jgi:glucose-6-phosphate 1-epimerase
MSKKFTLSRIQGLDAVEISAPDGARATLLLHGGQLLSWVPAVGDEQLYVSPQATFASGLAIRGGVPVIFPQFSGRGPLQHHGFARNKHWQLIRANQRDEDAIAVLRLTDDEDTRHQWPHFFGLELTVRVRGNDLNIELTCTNQGSAPFDFTCALHTYLRLESLDQCSIQGLQGLSYFDMVEIAEETQLDHILVPKGQLDRIYKGVQQELQVAELRGQTKRTLQIHQQGFTDVVVWNPGIEKCTAIVDMPDEGYQNMLCIEAAKIIQPVILEPNQIWSGTQTLKLL